MLTIDDLRIIRQENDDIYLGESSAKMEKETQESWKLIFEQLEELYPEMKAIKQKGNMTAYQVEVSHGKLGSLPVVILFDTVWGVQLLGVVGDLNKLTGEQIFTLLSQQTYSGGFTISDSSLCLIMRVPIHCMMPYTFYELLLTFADDQANTVIKVAEYLGITPDDSDEDTDDEDDEDEQAEVSLADIFKATPKTNCKEGGCPTCMIFAREVLHRNISIDECPYIE